MGVIATRREYLQEIRELTEKNNIVLIFDEVISGFRVALGVQTKYWIKPDLTLGKS